MDNIQATLKRWQLDGKAVRDGMYLAPTFGRLRGPLLRVAGLAFLFSLGLALPVGYGLQVAGLAETPLFVAIILAATALAVVVLVLKDAGETPLLSASSCWSAAHSPTLARSRWSRCCSRARQIARPCKLA